MESLHLTTAHNSTDTRVFDKQATSLAEAGFETGILAHNPPKNKLNGVQFFDLSSANSRIERWQSLPTIAQKAMQIDAAVYHFHDPELIPVGLYLTLKADGAVIYDVHEDYGHKIAGRDWIPDYAKPAFSHTFPLLEKRTALRFDAIITATERIKQMFAKRHPHVSTVHNFPRTKTLPQPTFLTERTTDYVLAYVGGLNELRGIHRMLDLLFHLIERGMDVELWALGAWSSQEDKYCAKSFIEEHKLEQRVRFPGHVDYHEMFQYLYNADVGLSLLDRTQFENAIPTKQFEYLYSGLPVVSTPLDAAIRFIPDEFRYIVPQDDPSITADNVETALGREHELEKMQALVEKRYSWESEAETLLSVYEELI